MEPGSAVQIAMTKYGGAPHWTYPARYLGSDAFGEWLGVPAGSRHARPGRFYDSAVDSVVLVPAQGAYALVGLHAPGFICEVYVDVSTPAQWDATGEVPRLSAVDLDLDVVRLPDGTVYLDDADEFAEHQITLSYPSELIAAAEASGAAVLADVRAGRAPYDGHAEGWLARLAELR